MYCRNCGVEVSDQSTVCLSCGCLPQSGKNYCQNCKNPTDPAAVICVNCGVQLLAAVPQDARSKLVAALLGIFIGGFGVHRFYLGYMTIGAIQILVTLITCGFGALWGFIEGILILVGNIDKDAYGRPLKD